LGCFIASALAAQEGGPEDAGKPLRFGIIGCDTSHAIAFTSILNDPQSPQHVGGGRVVAAFKGGSPDVESSYSRVDKFTQELKERWGVEIIASIDELVSRVDAVLLESVDGRPHLEQVKPVFRARKPVFIDKPLAGSYADCLEILRLARESGTPCFSSSSLRFYGSIAALKKSDKAGDIIGVTAWSPISYEEHHPDLFWYGVHGVEILFTLMGPGCASVSRTQTPEADVVVGVWKDGRVGTYRGIRKGKSSYGALVFGAKDIVQSEPVTGSVYKDLVGEIVRFARGGAPPVSLEETVEIFAFMEAADESKRRGGAVVRLDTLQTAAPKAD
jgi:hypothetical protein